MLHPAPWLRGLAILLAAATARTETAEALTLRATRLHHGILTLDSHCDALPVMLAFKGWDIGQRHPSGTFLGGDLDLVRMKEGGLSASFFAVFTSQGPRTPEGREAAFRKAVETLDTLDAMFQRHAGLCARALAPDDAERIRRSGRRAIFLGMENGYPVGTDLSRVDYFYQRGVRYLTLCHASDNDLAASSTDSPSVSTAFMTGRNSADMGLTPFGREVVLRMNDLGMMVDVSHISPRALEDVLRLSPVPVIASHSSARALHDHPRNLSDAQLRAIRAKGGVVQAVPLSEFLRSSVPDPVGDKAWEAYWERVGRHFQGNSISADPAAEAAFEAEYQELRKRHPLFWASVKDFVDHIDHLVRIIGADHVGIGTDFNGGGGLTDCRDVSELPAITVELVRRGYSQAEIRGIWGGNLLRVFRQAMAAAKPRRVASR